MAATVLAVVVATTPRVAADVPVGEPTTEAVPATEAVPTTEAVPMADPGLPAEPAAQARGSNGRSLVLSASAVAGTYAVLYGWLSLAWFTRTTDAPEFGFHDEGWFGVDTYAGGADKLGHAWGNYAMTRGVSRILRYGGWHRTGSILASGGMSLAFFTVSEIKDGYKVEYGFSWGDMVFNTSGVVLGMAMELVPALDRRVDFRISYLPSSEYLEHLKDEGPFNTPEDYSGQTMLLSYHLGSIDYVRRELSWVRYLDLSLGFRSRNYLPKPDDGAARRQELFVGLSLDAQAMVDALTGQHDGALHFVTDVYQPPYTTLPFGALSRSQPQPAVVTLAP